MANGRKERDEEMLMTAVKVAAEFEEEYIPARTLYEGVYLAWRAGGIDGRKRQMFWTHKQFYTIISKSGLFDTQKKIYKSKRRVHYLLKGD